MKKSGKVKRLLSISKETTEKKEPGMGGEGRGGGGSRSRSQEAGNCAIGEKRQSFFAPPFSNYSSSFPMLEFGKYTFWLARVREEVGTYSQTR